MVTFKWLSMEKDVIFPQNYVVMASASRGLTGEVGDR